MVAQRCRSRPGRAPDIRERAGERPAAGAVRRGCRARRDPRAHDLGHAPATLTARTPRQHHAAQHAPPLAAVARHGGSSARATGCGLCGVARPRGAADACRTPRVALETRGCDRARSAGRAACRGRFPGAGRGGLAHCAERTVRNRSACGRRAAGARGRGRGRRSAPANAGRSKRTGARAGGEPVCPAPGRGAPNLAAPAASTPARVPPAARANRPAPPPPARKPVVEVDDRLGF